MRGSTLIGIIPLLKSINGDEPITPTIVSARHSEVHFSAAQLKSLSASVTLSLRVDSHVLLLFNVLIHSYNWIDSLYNETDFLKTKTAE